MKKILDVKKDKGMDLYKAVVKVARESNQFPGMALCSAIIDAKEKGEDIYVLDKQIKCSGEIIKVVQRR